VRIAVCSLSELTHVAEFLDAAELLGERHTIRFFPGFERPTATALLESRGLAGRAWVAGAGAEPPDDPGALGSAGALLERYFLAHAEAVLPRLLASLESFRPDLVLAHLRDWAGVAAAERLRVPFVSFGSHASPVRCEAVDPPFGAPLDRDAPAGMRRLMWALQRELDARLDGIHNERIRRPHGLPDVQGTSTLHSRRLVILSLVPALSSKRSAEPAYVRHVGPLFTRRASAPGEDELVDRIASSARPRVFVSLGTTFVAGLLERCLAALADFPGTVVASGGGRLPHPPNTAAHALWAPFVSGVDAVLEHVDAVVTVGAGKTVVESLAHGRPLVCLPRQGEQWEIALAARRLGAAVVPCRGRFDPSAFLRGALEAATEPGYARSARALRDEIIRAGGALSAAEAVEGLFGGGDGR
jgi:UDP:flavonoid glycosyltransferase YjiC (YdhE family)